MATSKELSTTGKIQAAEDEKAALDKENAEYTKADADESADDILKAMRESNNNNKKAKENENKNETNSDITDAEIKKEAYADANKLGAKLEDLTKGMEEKANAN